MQTITGRILLAEDGSDNQRLIGHILRSAGAEVVVVSDGKQAVESALASLWAGQAFGLIVMDMQMPGTDGYAAAKQLRAQGWKGPILALTAHALAGDRELCISAGCDDYMTKPANREELVETCAIWLKVGRGVRGVRGEGDVGGMGVGGT